MGRQLPKSSEAKLAGVNKRLADFIRQLSFRCHAEFIVTEGVRSRTRQMQLYKERKTRTMNSKHIIGRAVDIAPIIFGEVSWDWKHFTPIIECAKALSVETGLPLTFGYDWGWDAPHIEMKEP